MKTIKSIALALVLLIGTTLSATNPVDYKVKHEKAIQEIAQLLKSPNFEVESDTSVAVSLMVNSDGELVVLHVATNNERVERYIKNRLNYYKLENSLEKGKQYKLPVRIKLAN